MKKMRSKLTALCLSMVLAFSLVLPALAFEDTNPPLWKSWGYSSLEEFPIWHDITEEEYYSVWAAGAPAEQTEIQVWIDTHPEQAAAFSPEAYLLEIYPWYDSAQEYMDSYGLSQEEFHRVMLLEWAEDQLDAEKAGQELADFIATYPEEYAAFDPFAYFAKHYSWYHGTPQDFIEQYEMSEETFRFLMLCQWMQTFLTIAGAKEQAGGFATGINVMVNGQCVPFPDVRPELKNWRTMVPLAPLAEHLGAQVLHDPAAGAVQVTLEDLSFTHVIGSSTLTLSDGSVIQMDVPSYVKDNRTMVPAAFIAQLLDYEISWDDDFDAAVLTDRQGLLEDINQKFTLINRILHTASGADQLKEGQALERSESLSLELTLFDTLHGDRKISGKLTGSAVFSEKALQASLSGDLSGLVDYFLESIEPLDGAEQALVKSYRDALSGLSIELILNLEQGAAYVRSPGLAKIGLIPVEDPEAWAAMPFDSSILSGLSWSPTIGQWAVEIAEGSPFLAWSIIASAVDEMEFYIGDSAFTSSGGSYTLSVDFAPYGWSHSWDTSAVTVKVTPSGEKSCTYSIVLQASSDEAALDLSLTGSSGTADCSMYLHLKNSFKFNFTGRVRSSGTDKQPLSAPPAGSKIEFPAGPLGSGSL